MLFGSLMGDFNQTYRYKLNIFGHPLRHRQLFNVKLSKISNIWLFFHCKNIWKIKDFEVGEWITECCMRVVNWVIYEHRLLDSLLLKISQQLYYHFVAWEKHKSMKQAKKRIWPGERLIESHPITSPFW